MLRSCLLYLLVTVVCFTLVWLIGYIKDRYGFFTAFPKAETYNKRFAPKQAKTIYAALNLYYSDHGEYPEQIYGGSPGKWPTKPKGFSDPLLSSGYLSEYPRRMAKSSNPIVYYGHVKAGNLVSAPNDAIVRAVIESFSAQEPSKYYLEWTDPEWRERKYKQYQQNMVEYKDKLARFEKFKDSVKVIFVGGGIWPSPERIEEDHGSPGPIPSIILPGLRADMKDVFYRDDSSWGDELAGNFGYVRGERMGSDKKTAFLWIYGKLKSTLPYGAYVPLSGLDILNANTGELKPDGIPDGVVIKFELREGQVVNITKAEDM